MPKHRVLVQIYTFGVKFAHWLFGEAVLTHYRGFTDLIFMAAWRNGTVHDEDASVMVFDCWRFYDPEG